MTGRIARGVVPIRRGCSDEPDACGEDLRENWRTKVHDMPKCLTFHGLGDTELGVRKIFGPCEEYIKDYTHPDGAEICITEQCCELMLLKPGLYEFYPKNDDALPLEFMPEEYNVGLEWAALLQKHFLPCPTKSERIFTGPTAPDTGLYGFWLNTVDGCMYYCCPDNTWIGF